MTDPDDPPFSPAPSPASDPAVLRAQAALLTHVSHELRTPMNGVLGNLDLLMETLLTPQQRQFAETAREGSRCLLRLLDDLLELARLEAGRLELQEAPFDLRVEAEEALQALAPLAASKGLALRAAFDPPLPPPVLGDAGHLRQVLLHLLSNAVKFTAEGRVDLRCACLAEGGSLRIRLEVADTGPGVPEAMRDRLFTPFAAGGPGLGLGLAVARRLMAAMGGTLDLVPGPGGARFRADLALPASASGPGLLDPPPGRPRVLLAARPGEEAEALHGLAAAWDLPCAAFLALPAPEDAPPADAVLVDASLLREASDLWALQESPALAGARWILLQDASGAGTSLGWAFGATLARPWSARALRDALGAPTAALPVPEPPGVPGRARRILVVEDNATNQALVKAHLEQMGHQADLAGDGLQALEACAAQAYDVVLMDCQMPVMDGYTATRRIRAELPPSRQPFIVALTANAFPEDEARCLEAGMDAYLSKPFRKEALARLIEGPAEPAGRGGTAPADADPLARAVARLAEEVGQETVPMLVGLFLQESRKGLEGMEAAGRAGDPAAIRRLAHQLKSSCAAFDLHAVRGIAEAMELAPEDPTARLPELRAALEAAWPPLSAWAG